MVSQSVRVVIADDHPVVRAGLDAMIQADPYITVVGLAINFEQLLVRLETQAVDVVVLDLSGMGNVPLAMLHRLRRDHQDVAIVIFSSSVDMAPELLQAGARGYVLKEEDAEQLMVAIHAAANGHNYTSPLVQEYIERATYGRVKFRFSPQELNVLKLMSQSLGTTEIAEALGIDPRTVQNYITSMRAKAHVTQRSQLIDIYRRYFANSDDSRIG